MTLSASECGTRPWRNDFLAAGYQPYTDSLKASRGPDRMYVGSAQRRYRDGRGTLYFLNVDFYDFTMHEGGRKSASAHVQFQMADESWDGCANIGREVEGSIAETEAWFADLWHRMRWGYYEVDDDSVPAANVPADVPASPSTGARS